MWRLIAALAVLLLVTSPVTPVGASDAPNLSGLTWSSLSPPTAPPGLRDASAAYDPLDGTVVVFGGVLASGRFSDQTWVWNGSTWSTPSLFGALPPARAYASMAFDASFDPPQLILFGGRSSGGALLDDTWAWNGASWNEVFSTVTPGVREEAALAPDHAGHLVLFGGYGVSNAGSRPFTTTTVPTTTTTTAPAASPTATGSVPATSVAPTSADPTTTVPATPDPADSSTSTSTSTTAASDPTVTTTPAASPTDTDATPAVRRVRTELAAARSRYRVLGDTWVLMQVDGADQWVEASTASAPPALAGASMSMGPADQTVLFGGSARPPGPRQAGAARAQTWIWSGTAWSTPRSVQEPSARLDAGLDDSGQLGDALLFGGLGPHGPLADTWLWTGRAWLPVTPATPPVPRSAAVAAADTGSRQFLVFGGLGRGGALLDDTVVLSTQPPTKVNTSPSTQPGTSTTSAPGGGAKATSGHARKTAPVTTTVAVHRGDVITLTGSGFLPHAAIAITFHSQVVVVGRTRADAEGRFTANVAVPSNAPAGHHHFEATGTGPSGLNTLVTPVTVVTAAVGGHLSRTIKVTLVGIAVAIPILTWFFLGSIPGLRRRHQTA